MVTGFEKDKENFAFLESLKKDNLIPHYPRVGRRMALVNSFFRRFTHCSESQTIHCERHGLSDALQA